MDKREHFNPMRAQQKNERKNENQAKQKTSCLTTKADKIRAQYGIEVEGENVPEPIERFDEIPLPNRLRNFLRSSKQLVKPTPIQMQAIGCLLIPRDTICLSSTGSGKTYGYLLPLCSILWKRYRQHISSSNDNISKPLCVIIVPTRELMQQVYESTEELIKCLQLQTRNPQSEQNEMLKDKSSSVHNYDTQLQNMNHSPQQPMNHPPRHNMSFPFQQKIEHVNWNVRIGQQPPNISSNHYAYQSYSSQCQFQNQYYNHYQQSRQEYQFQHQYQQHNSHDWNLGSFYNDPPHRRKAFVMGLCGGVPIKENLNILSDETKVIISTPGRLLDLCDKGRIDLSKVVYFVIDECDKALEMQMEEQLRKIVAMVTVNENPELQTSLWSATLPESLERLARSAVVDPIYICTGVKDIVPVNIKQEILFLHTYQKNSILLEVLRKTPSPPVIVFAASKTKVDEVTQFLQNEQFHAAAMHSGKDQEVRKRIMEDFRGDVIDVLVATDLISRGLDLPAVTHVIHYNTPDTIEDYIHRCGRTGRFGRIGLTTILLTLDCKIARELKDLCELTNTKIPPQLKDTKMFGKKILYTDMGDRIV